MTLVSMNDLLYILIVCELIVIILLSVSIYNEKNYVDDEEREMTHMTGYYQGYRDSLLDVKNVILSKGRELRDDDLVDALDKHDELWSRIFKKYRD
jgi:hypothetical protein